MALEINNTYNQVCLNTEKLAGASYKSNNTVSKEEYLNQLTKNYSNINIIEGNYRQGTMFGAKGQSNIMISPVILNKMANDPEAAAKYEEIINGIPAAEKWLRAQCSSNGMKLLSCGFIVDENGDVSSYSYTVTTSEGSQDNSEKKDKLENRNYHNVKMKQKEDKELQESIEDRIEEKSLEQNIISQRVLNNYNVSQINTTVKNKFLKKV